MSCFVLFTFHGTSIHQHEAFLVDTDLFERIAPLPDFSVLEMYLGSYGHDFGAMMLHLLGTCSAILRLKVIMRSSKVILQSGYLIYNLS